MHQLGDGVGAAAISPHEADIGIRHAGGLVGERVLRLLARIKAWSQNTRKEGRTMAAKQKIPSNVIRRVWAASRATAVPACRHSLA